MLSLLQGMPFLLASPCRLNLCFPFKDQLKSLNTFLKRFNRMICSPFGLAQSFILPFLLVLTPVTAWPCVCLPQLTENQWVQGLCFTHSAVPSPIGHLIPLILQSTREKYSSATSLWLTMRRMLRGIRLLSPQWRWIKGPSSEIWSLPGSYWRQLWEQINHLKGSIVKA